MTASENRKGYEFSSGVRRAAFRRSQGRCEYPEGCEQPHDRTVDHLTSIRLGKLRGLDRQMLKSLENAQVLCSFHQRMKLWEEDIWIENAELQSLNEMQVRGAQRWRQS